MPPVEPTLKTLCSVNLKKRFFMQITNIQKKRKKLLYHEKTKTKSKLRN